MNKHSAPILAALCLILSAAQAQDESSINTGTGVGFQISQFQNDFGLGINVTSPYFVHDRIAVRLKGNFMFNESEQDGLVNWWPYANASLGLIGVGGMVGEHIRAYGEGGFLGILPSDEFSTEQFVFGGYGTFGFEFFMASNINYFIELGAVGTGARADKVAGRPIYSNGFLVSVGFRFSTK